MKVQHLFTFLYNSFILQKHTLWVVHLAKQYEVSTATLTNKLNIDHATEHLLDFVCPQFPVASTGTKATSTRSVTSIHSQSTCSVTPLKKKALHRHDSEGSCLSVLKETIEKDGDLAKTVVRIEVCYGGVYVLFAFVTVLSKQFCRLRSTHRLKKFMMVLKMERYWVRG